MCFSSVSPSCFIMHQRVTNQLWGERYRLLLSPFRFPNGFLPQPWQAMQLDLLFRILGVVMIRSAFHIVALVAFIFWETVFTALSSGMPTSTSYLQAL